MLLLTIILCILPVLLIYTLFTTYKSLAAIPGPLINKFTNVPRLLSVWHRNSHDELLSLHKQHGDLVRLGPNMVSLAGGWAECAGDAAAAAGGGGGKTNSNSSNNANYISQIYGIGKGLVKSDFYAVFQNIVNGKRAASLVAMTDESLHAKTKRTIAHAYSLSTLVEFEPLVDSTTVVFLNEMETRFVINRAPSMGHKQQCDLGRWLQFYAFDVIGELTFSKRLGFIEKGEDVNDIIKSIGANFDYFSVLGQMPWLDETFLGKNPLYVNYFRKSVASPILKFAQRLLQERLEGEDEDEEKSHNKKLGGNSSGKPDFLTRFLQIRRESEEPLSDGQMLSLLFMNINAGSDTIASTLRAIFYHLLTNPSTLDRLVAELETACANGNMSLPCPKWHETQSQHATYLRAVIKEGIRLNPALSLPLERIVPKEGLTATVFDKSSWKTNSGQPTATKDIFLPPATIVGINPYVHHRNQSIFGVDAEDWNPARWLARGNLAFDDERIKAMESQLLSFGAGKRSCMGKNIAMLELQKLVPALIMKFKFSWAEGYEDGKKWKIRNSWVLCADGLVVDVQRRHSQGCTSI